MKAFFQQHPRIFSWVCLLAFFVPLATTLAIDKKNLVETKATMTNITREDIERLPAGRNLQDVLLLAPGVQSGGPDGNQTLTPGGSPFDQLMKVDGIIIDNPLVRGQYLNLPVDMIEEVQVISGGAPAEYGTASGAVINVVTRRGTNEWHGGASLFTTPGGFSANPEKGITSSGPQSYDSYFEPSLNLGGPIIKDKLWFFGNFTAVSKKPMTQYEDEATSKQNQFNSFANFTYKADENNTFSLSHLYGRPKESFDGKTHYNLYAYDYYTTYNYLNFDYRRQFMNGWQAGGYLNLGHQGLNAKDNNTHSSGTEGDQTESSSDYFKEKSFCDFEAGLDFMSELYDCWCGPNQFGGGISYQSSRLQKTVESSHGYTNTETGSGHTYVNQMESYDYLYQRYDYSRISAYVQDTWSIGDKLTLNVGLRFDKESLSMPKESDKRPDNLPKPDWQSKPDIDWSVISPRIGLTYDITGDGKTVVKASYGRYACGLHYDYFIDTNPLAGWGYNYNTTLMDGSVIHDDRNDWYNTPQSRVYDKDFNAPILTELTLAFEKALSDDFAVSVTGFYKKQNSHLQTVDASRLDIDKLMDDGKLEWLNYDPVHVNTTVNMDLFQDTDPTRQSEYTIANVPGADSRYTGVQIAIQKKLKNGWMASGSFTWSDFQGMISPYDYTQYYGMSNLYQNPNAQVNTGGPFQYISPWQFKFNGTYQLPWGVNMGGNLIVSGGSPYTQYYYSYNPPFSSYELGHGTIYGEPQGDSRLPTFWMLNLGLEKSLKINDKYTATLVVDWYNATNNQVPLSANALIGSGSTDEIERILNPGLFQFGVRVSF